ncbi:MAG: MFS transporter [Drouetiella hepatica Uher 2000/2452]|jgi:MFS family permease|uniref:MFS transporter n=1 Tax=Drouetiella hepatica Uher 2000/2452 TaxID=904376 RepID=A0A951QH74_9CYAN|nr:MFS transporter [Drouetiella hepatica Uher 2000/2452]
MRTLNQVEVSEFRQPTLWLPVCALALVYAMFALGWMIYRVHLPAQMTQFGFSAQAVPLLLLIEALLSIAVEPLAGAFSDRTNRHRGTRFPIIGVGVALTALLFVILPALAFAEPNTTTRWILVSLLLIWSIAMSCFRSPALALLKRYAPTLRLPQAASMLTFAFGLTAAATPLASPAVLKLGTTVSFTCVAILILLSAIWLRWMNPITLAASEPAEYFNSAQPIALVPLARSFGLGLTSTLALRLAIETFPKILAQIALDKSGVQPPLLVGLLFISLAIAAIPVGKLAVRQGNSYTMLLGVVITALFLGSMILVYSPAIAVIVALGLGIGFSLILNGTLPFALEQVPPDRAGLGIGIFFAGVATASSLMLGTLGTGVLSPNGAIALAIVALIGAGLCIGANWRRGT